MSEPPNPFCPFSQFCACRQTINCLSFVDMNTSHSPHRSKALQASWIVLRVLIVLNWISGVLIFVLLAATFQTGQWTWRALGVGTVAGHEGLIAGMRSIAVIG